MGSAEGLQVEFFDTAGHLIAMKMPLTEGFQFGLKGFIIASVTELDIMPEIGLSKIIISLLIRAFIHRRINRGIGNQNIEMKMRIFGCIEAYPYDFKRHGII